MDGVVFFGDLIAFVVVVYWAYANEASSDGATRGMLAMKVSALAPFAGAARAARWRRADKPDGRAPPPPPRPPSAPPKWRG